jgi:hypothetical protein
VRFVDDAEDIGAADLTTCKAKPPVADESGVPEWARRCMS